VGALDGGDFGIDAGFWGVAMSTGTYPELEIAWLPGGKLRITWPYPSTGFQLEWAGALSEPVAGTVWSGSGLPAASIVAGSWQVVLDAAAPVRFLRLSHP
jgi:hypothetical protein